MKETSVKRFEIYNYNFGVNPGHIQSGYRPVLVVQDDRMNENSPTTIIAAITTAAKKTYLPSHVLLGPEYGLDKPSNTFIAFLLIICNKNAQEALCAVLSLGGRFIPIGRKKAHRAILCAYVYIKMQRNGLKIFSETTCFLGSPAPQGKKGRDRTRESSDALSAALN